jgi:extracellular elastinolytic metalloproteinase
LSKRDRGQSAVDFAASKLQKDASSMYYRSGFSRDGIDVAYIKQVHNDIPFANTAANVAFKNDKVVSFGSSFVDTGEPSSFLYD